MFSIFFVLFYSQYLKQHEIKHNCQSPKKMSNRSCTSNLNDPNRITSTLLFNNNDNHTLDKYLNVDSDDDCVKLILIDFKENNSSSESYCKLLNNIKRQQFGRRKWLENRQVSYSKIIPIEFYCDSYFISKHEYKYCENNEWIGIFMERGEASKAALMLFISALPIERIILPSDFPPSTNIGDAFAQPRTPV